MANEGVVTVPQARPDYAGVEALRAALEAVSQRIHAPVASTAALALLSDAYDGMYCLVGTAAKTAYQYVAAAVSGDVASTGMGAGYWNIVTDTGALGSLSANGVAALVGTSRASTVEAELTTLIAGLASKVGMYHRLIDHADTDVAVAATTVEVDFGAALPTNAIVLAVLANVTEAWDDDGPTDTWEGDVGVSSGDADKYTPTPLTLDSIADLGSQIVCLDASATQLAFTITASGSKQLSELVAGKLDLTVIFFTPTLTEVTAPA